MFSENILYEVFSFLTLDDLLEASMVSRRWFHVSSTPIFYKNEFIRLFMSPTDPSHTDSRDWKAFCIQELLMAHSLTALENQIFSPYELSRVYTELNSTFAFPDAVLPELRRDFLAFPTVVQDLLVNHEAFNRTSPYETDERLNEKLELVKEMLAQNPEDLFAKFLLPISNFICAKVENYCQAVAMVMKESSDVIDIYIKYWDMYSLSIKKLHNVLNPFAEIFRQAYYDQAEGQQVVLSLIDLMIEIWTRTVYKKVEKRLFSEFFERIQEVYRGGYGDECVTCKAFVESLMDISLNRINIHFKNHSKVEINKIFKDFNKQLIESLKVLIKNPLNCEINGLFQILPAISIRCIKEEILVSDFELENQLNDNDYLMELRASNIGFSKSDMTGFARCKSIKLIDVFTHLKSFQLDFVHNN